MVNHGGDDKEAELEGETPARMINAGRVRRI